MMSAYKYTQQEMDDLIADIREGRNEVEALQAENQRLREALNDLYSMASSPQWRNEPLYRICKLLEQALEQSDGNRD